jgi:hypothetical protein
MRILYCKLQMQFTSTELSSVHGLPHNLHVRILVTFPLLYVFKYCVYLRFEVFMAVKNEIEVFRL